MLRNALSRRLFTKETAIGGVTCSLIPGRVMGANERVNIGLVGCGIKGCAHLQSFDTLSHAKIIAVSDPDKTRMVDPGELRRFPLGDDMIKHQDFRHILEMKEIDAVVIAAPNHWHAPATIMACEAGKHVYVEKPVSHTIDEGQRMIEAAHRHKRIVQAGLQHRSCPAVQECAADVQSGKYGKVKWVHTFKLMARKPIGNRLIPMKIPDYIDYDLWAGPAPHDPVMRDKLHYDWHWLWNYGNGETANWGVHYLDDVRHILGWKDIPESTLSIGARWWDDAGQTPAIHLSVMEHRGVPLVCDIRLVKDFGRGDKTGAIYRGARHGNYIMCEKGYIRIARGGGKAFSHDDVLIKQYKGTGGAGHDADFVQAIRDNNQSALACDIQVGHLSTVMAHMANLSYRAGGPASLDEIRATMHSSDDALYTLDAIETQLNGTHDFAVQPFTLGKKVHYAPDTGAGPTI